MSPPLLEHFLLARLVCRFSEPPGVKLFPTSFFSSFSSFDVGFFVASGKTGVVGSLTPNFKNGSLVCGVEQNHLRKKSS